MISTQFLGWLPTHADWFCESFYYDMVDQMNAEAVMADCAFVRYTATPQYPPCEEIPEVPATPIVKYRAANGHTMEYWADEDNPRMPARGAAWQAWCADDCPACANGEPLPDW